MAKIGMFDKTEMLRQVSRSGKTVVEVTRNVDAPEIITMVRIHANGSKATYGYRISDVSKPFYSLIETARGSVKTQGGNRAGELMRRQWIDINTDKLGGFYAETGTKNPLLSRLIMNNSNRIYDETVTEKLLAHVFGRKKAPNVEQISKIFANG